MFVIPAYERLKQEDLHKSEVTLGSKFQAIQNYTMGILKERKKRERGRKERSLYLHKFVNITEKTLSKTKLPLMVPQQKQVDFCELNTVWSTKQVPD